MITPDGRTPVVTAFVYSGDRVALIKRSGRVRTYPGRTGAFSGYIENLPMEQALRELEEEAGLTPQPVDLAGIGIPLPVDDVQDGYKWLVFPFLFALREGAEIRTDWEAEDWGWYSPDELAETDTVPGLGEALASVWPPFGNTELWNSLSDIATDREQGATELARRGLRAVGSYIQCCGGGMGHQELLRLVRAFAAARPTMGVFPDLAARLLLAIEREGGQFSFDTLITEMLNSINDATDLSVSAVAGPLGNYDSIFTLSYSETVRRAIRNWAQAGSHVIVAESDPGKEGLNLVEYLKNEGISVEIVYDSDIPFGVKRSDVVLVGCDSIVATGELQNKMGTRTAVEAASELGKPAYAIAQTFKICPPDWPLFIEEHETASEGRAESFPAFDLTSFSHFTAVYCEEGELTKTRLQEIQSELGKAGLLP